MHRDRPPLERSSQPRAAPPKDLGRAHGVERVKRAPRAAVVAVWLLGALQMAAGQSPAPSSASAAEVTGYTELRIVRPRSGETVHSNAGNVPIEVTLRPALRAGKGHRLRVVVDGKPAPGAWTTPTFTVGGVDRGLHVVQVVVVDASGQRLAASAAVEFNLWQASRLFPQRGDR